MLYESGINGEAKVQTVYKNTVSVDTSLILSEQLWICSLFCINSIYEKCFLIHYSIYKCI